LDLCKTCWAQRHDAYQHFYQGYTFIVQALESIGHSRHFEEYGHLYSDWDTGSRSEAQQLLLSITRFDFIVVFLIVYQYLSHLPDLTIKLQSNALDIIKANAMVGEVMTVYKSERSNVDEGFLPVYRQSLILADKVGINPSTPRIVQRQKHRSNSSAESVLDYFKHNVVIPFLDHIISNLDDRFLLLQSLQRRL
jgi:hypothetical protein